MAYIPDKPEVLYQLGLSYLRLEKREESSRCFKEYLQISPDGPEAEKVKNFLKETDGEIFKTRRMGSLESYRR